MKQPLAQIGPVCASPRATALGWTRFALLFLACGLCLRASDLPAPITLDLPIAANLATPSWLGHPEMPDTTFASLNLPILTPDTSASLLVTVYFQEKQGGFMRIIWNGTQGAQLLSDNFYENIGMTNQRSLLISPSMLVGDGTLNFQCGDTTLGIQRIKLEWLESKNGLVSPAVQDLLVTPAVGPTQPAQGLNGLANTPQPGAWQDQVVSVPITAEAIRVEQGVEFSVDLDTVPGSARLGLKETGLPLGKHLVIWINEQRAGTITPAVPDLKDTGFLADDNAATNYVGWRDGSFYVPVSLLKSGVNTLQLSDEDDSSVTASSTSDTQPPMAVKSMVLQLNYTVPEAKVGFLQPQMDLMTPTGPLPPSQVSPTPTNTPNP